MGDENMATISSSLLESKPIIKGGGGEGQPFSQESTNLDQNSRWIKKTQNIWSNYKFVYMHSNCQLKKLFI